MEFTKKQLKSFIEAVVCNTKDYVMNNDGFIEDWVKQNIFEKCEHNTNKMKTAIQELISEFENIKETKCKTLQEVIFFDGVLAIIEGKYIEKEKEQIIDFSKWIQLNGWGLLSNENWINKEAKVVSSEVLFDMYSSQAEN